MNQLRVKDRKPDKRSLTNERAINEGATSITFVRDGRVRELRTTCPPRNVLIHMCPDGLKRPCLTSVHAAALSCNDQTLLQARHP